MLDTTPENLYEEIQAAEKLRDTHLESYSDLVSQFVGSAYRDISDGATDTPENHVYEYLSLTVPRLVHDNPRVRVSSRRPVTQRMTAVAMEHGLNRWARDTVIRSPLMQVGYDMLLSFGALLTVEEPQPGFEPDDPDVPHWPRCYRISPRRFFMDPLALSFDQARFIGHVWIRDKEDLIEEAKDDSTWNRDFIESVSDDVDIDNYRDTTGVKNNTPTRKEILGYEIWVPEVQHDDELGPMEGFNGTIYTISMAQGTGDEIKVDYLREPRPYYGPPTGPYTVFGAYYVPDNAYPLSPLAATSGQSDDLNEHVIAARRAAAQYKRMVFVDAKNKKLQQDVASSPDNYVVPVENLDKDSIVPVELGGVTQQMITYIEMARERLDRNSGVQDAQRGVVTGDATATEVQIAEASGSLRFAYIRRQFVDAVNSAIRKVAWFMFHDDRVAFPIGIEAAEAMGQPEPWWVGGMQSMMTGERFEDLEMEVEAYSMERTNEALMQKRAMETLQIVTQSAPMMVQMPFLEWDSLLKMVGDAMNMPELGELINKEAMQQFMQAQQEAAAQQQQADVAGGQSDVTMERAKLALGM